ncbi:PPOX class F420-dependent oxidoreductase [Streptomyces sp. NPDC017529]|uniref:PPOX class F420-dependent oxidoreductase n=1 Tax=Streptomyces sp. NPDC017529 TaxID=3365000 RepID=UPI00378FA33C
MPAALSDDSKNVLDGPVFVTTATVQPDGSPHLSPVRVKRDGDDVLFCTTDGCRKVQNPRRDPRVTVLVRPSGAPYTYSGIRGSAELVTEGGRELIGELSRKYTGMAYAEFDPGVPDNGERVVVRVTPHKVVGRL